MQATARAFPEYPFMPDQSRIRADAYGPVAQSHYPDSLVEVSAARTPFLLGREQLNRSHNYHGQVSRVRLLSQQEQQGVAVPSPADDNTFVPASIRNPMVVQEDSYMLPDGQVFPNDVIIRMERKRKVFPKHSKDAGYFLVFGGVGGGGIVEFELSYFLLFLSVE